MRADRTPRSTAAGTDPTTTRRSAPHDDSATTRDSMTDPASLTVRDSMNTSVPAATDNRPPDLADPTTDLLRPVPDDDGAPFWEYAARGELRVQTCSDCDEPRFPPRPCCPHCQSFTAHWQRMSGRGRIWSYVVPHPPLLPAYAAQAPYNAIVIELAEAPRIRLVGNLVTAPDAALNSVDPARLRIGAPVRVVFHTPPGGPTLPRWVLERP